MPDAGQAGGVELPVLGGERELVIARELTKVFETIHACRLDEALAWLDSDPNRGKGEFVLVVGSAPAVGDARAEEGERVLGILLRELALKQAVQLAAEITGAKRNALYARALELQSKAITAKDAKDAKENR